MSPAATWLAGARPRTLPAALAPVLAGTGVAAYIGDTGHTAGIVWWKALLALLVSLALQVGVNYANDYSDGTRGTDDDRVGPTRLVASGAASPAAVRTAAVAALAVAAAAGLVLAVTTAWWLVLVGLACVAAAWGYTGGSRPYGYAGWGEVMVFCFFGLVAVVGTAYVQVEELSALAPALPAAVGTGLLATALLVVNNLRDISSDRATGKRTLAVRLGDERTRALFALCLGGAAVALVWLGLATTSWALLAGVFLLPAVPAARDVLRGARGTDLITALGRCGSAELLFGAGAFLGLLVASTGV